MAIKKINIVKILILKSLLNLKILGFHLKIKEIFF